MNYRSEPLDLSTRITIATEMLMPIPQRPWGYATRLAETFGVSRTWLYELKHRAEEALIETLAPRPPGPQPHADRLVIDRAFVQQVITTLPLLRGSVRGIQEGLDLLFGIDRSIGHISQTLQQAGNAAGAINASLSLPLPVLAEADEIFQGKQPCLTIVDGRSFLVLNLSAEEKRDATTWGVTFLDLQQRGIAFADIASDGARGIKAGACDAQLAVPLRLDWFHLLREAHQVTARLERFAIRAMKTAERSRRAQREAMSHRRRRGRPLALKIPHDQALAEEQLTIQTHDLWIWLVSEVRQALEPMTAKGGITSVDFARNTVRTAAELMGMIPDKKAQGFGQKLLANLEELVAPLDWLNAQVAAVREQIDAPMEATIVWAWQHQQQLALEVSAGFDESLQPCVRAFWTALDWFHRTSSMAECLHSWLRPFLVIHRGMPDWLLPLLQLYWNHHSFARGKRAGKSPVQVAGIAEAPSLKSVLSQLFCAECEECAA